MKNYTLLKKIILTSTKIFKDIFLFLVCALVGTILICECLEHGWLLNPNKLQSVSNEEFCFISKLLFSIMPIVMFINGIIGKYKVEVEEIKINGSTEINNEVVFIHEAGHIFLVKHFGYELINVSYDRTKDSLGQTTWKLPQLPSKDDLINGIVIAYGGFYAEMLINHMVTTGSMKDFEDANELIKQYLLISETISFTGYEKELMEQKSIEISNQCRKMAKDLISSHINEVRDISVGVVNENI